MAAIALGAAGTPLAMRMVVESSTRAVRYALCMPVLYRSLRQEHWSEGLTANVSASGVLIVGDLPSGFAEPIAVVIALPDSDGCLTGCGRLARVAEAGDARGSGTFAVAVSQFSIEHQPAALSRLRVLHREC